MKTITIRAIWLLLPLFLASGCASLPPVFQKPEVHLVRLQPLPSRGMEQRFSIGLRVSNPNRTEMKVRGISYSLSLQGHQVVSGVANDIPRIAAYSEATLDLEAATDLLGSLRAIVDLLSRPGEAVKYELTTKIDTGWWGLPVTVVEAGTIDLGP